MQDKDKIILFPNMKETWIEKSFQAIEREDYEEALYFMNKLIEHNVANNDIRIGKILCHTQLGQSVDAELYCEELLEDQTNPLFYEFLFYYVSILFDSNKYAKLIHYIDQLEASVLIPEQERQKYQEIYDMSQVMNDNEAKNILKEVTEHIALENFYQAYILLQRWDRLGVALPSNLEEMLIDDKVHIVIKTYILKMLRQRKVDRLVRVKKMTEEITVNPKLLVPVALSDTYKAVDQNLLDLEQDNPILYTLLVELLEHFLYVHYPEAFMENIDEITEALYIIGEHYFLQSLDEKQIQTNNVFVLKIMQAQQYYLEIISH